MWQTEEGLAVKPYYREEDIAALDSLRRSARLLVDRGRQAIERRLAHSRRD